MVINYSKTNTPDDYKCSSCEASGVKLWREYNIAVKSLLCVTCVAAKQNLHIDNIDADGTYIDKWGFRSDQISGYVPAIPDPENVYYWGYTSVPSQGLTWWRNLPLKNGVF